MNSEIPLPHNPSAPDNEKWCRQRQANYLGRLIHKLQNDLMVISLSTSTLQTMDTLKEIQRKELFTNVLNAAKKANLVLGPLYILRMLWGEMESYQFRKSDLRTLMKQCLDPFQELAAQRGITLEYIEKTNDNPAWIAYDEKFLPLAVSCLIDNSLRFSAKGQSIRFGLMKSHTEFVIEILDRGIGIKEEHQQHLFEPYFSYHPDLGLYPKDSLGLSLVFAKRVVEQHGGILDIRSKEGRGTVAFIHFPSVS